MVTAKHPVSCNKRIVFSQGIINYLQCHSASVPVVDGTQPYTFNDLPSRCENSALISAAIDKVNLFRGQCADV